MSNGSWMTWPTAERANGLRVARILPASSTCSESLSVPVVDVDEQEVEERCTTLKVYEYVTGF